MKNIKIFSLLLLGLFAFNAFGMERDDFKKETENKDEEVSNVSSLKDLCIQAVVKNNLHSDQKKLGSITQDSKDLLAKQIMQNHPIIPLILQNVTLDDPIIINSLEEAETILKSLRNMNNWHPGYCQYDDKVEITDNSIDQENPRTILTIQGTINSLCHPAVNKDYTKIIVVPSHNENVAQIYDASTQKCIFTLAEHTDTLSKVELNLDGTKACTASQDGIIKIWDLNNNAQCIGSFAHQITEKIGALLFSDDATKIIVAANFGTLRMEIWDLGKLNAAQFYLENFLIFDQANLLDQIRPALQNNQPVVLTKEQEKTFSTFAPEVQESLKKLGVKISEKSENQNN